MAFYQVSADRFSGTPYVRVRRVDSARVHHKAETARIDAWARSYWGDKAGAIRHADGDFTVVWCDSFAPDFPGMAVSNDTSFSVQLG